jgi:hypothetical protein
MAGSVVTFQGGGHARYQTKSEVEILEFDNRLRASARLVICGDRHYELGRVATTIVEMLQGPGMSLDELYDFLQDRHSITRVQLTLAVQQLWLFGIVKNVDDTAPGPILAPRKQPGLAFPFLRAEWLKPLTNFLAKSISARALWPLAGAGVVLHVLVWLHYHTIIAPLFHTHPRPATAALVILFSAMLHELAHAAACTNRGVRHGPIGFMIYTIFPALYTDVSDAWRLPSRDRLIVDGAGVLTSFLLASLAAALLLLSPNYPSALLLLLNDSFVLVNLNPFLKMDGYWLISDMLRVPNLMGCNQEVTKWLLSLLLWRKREVPAILRTKGILVVYLAYYLLWCAFMCWFGFYIFTFGKAFWIKAEESGIVRSFFALTLSAKMQLVALVIIAIRLVYSTSKMAVSIWPALRKSSAPAIPGSSGEGSEPGRLAG